MNGVAMAWRELGRFDEALKLLEEAAQHGREVLGTNHPYTITFYNNVALVAEDAGETNQALRLFEETFQQRRELLGPDHRATLRAMNYWARALMRSGQVGQAETLLREAERRWRATAPGNVLTASATLANLTGCLLLKGDPVAAEVLAREYVALAAESSPRPWSKAEASGLLGAALLDQGQFKAAETNLLAAFDELQANYARVPAHTGPRLRQAIGQWMIQLQQTMGQSDLAEQWRQRLKRLEQQQKQQPQLPQKGES
jgi:tetratricopeptide (TPR) repeat protein